ncbi:MAG: hypothetical protein PPHEINF_1702 [uncultured Paraburkholderia sp.]|nr:MAG: hypothetical protein PPHEINF_1702 [uncultured Paraburkholderia sp.]CAH2783598.1 MAG: hypothetical protein PPHEESC_1744 [uncultured Paraburkholderia sp.]CAH2917711.1 MAG: hypothetical protein PPHERAN_1708 [uncultured Paraburkholderia sp.]CAH2918640.1 MAG: hypothetical protein PPHEMADMSA_1858 [uncultured Paraburkholderia sp.]
MKALIWFVAMLAVLPVANAEQGDAEDQALTELMTKQTVTHETQPTQGQADTAYGDNGKTANQAVQY